MARPKRLRRLAFAPPALRFLPALEGKRQRAAETVTLTLDEFEAIRLSDLECHSQEEAARKMDVSRATFGRIIESGRAKVATVLVHGCRLQISGGTFVFGIGRSLRCPRCRCRQALEKTDQERIDCRKCRQPLLSSAEQSAA